MTALVVAGLAGIVARRRAERPAAAGSPPGSGSRPPARSRSGLAGAWVLYGGDDWGAPFTSELTPQAGIDGLTGFFLAMLALVACPALVFASRTSPRTRAAGSRARSARRFLLVADRRALRARPADVPRRLGADDARPGRDHPRRAPRPRPPRRTVFTYVAITHLGGAGTWIAVLLLADEGAIGDATALERRARASQIAIAVAALVGIGTKAGLVPLHAWLPARPPDRPGPRLGADERRDDQGGRLRPRPRARRVARRAAGLVRRRRARRSAALSALVGVVYALFQHELKRLLASPLDRERRDHRARRSAPASCCARRGADAVGRVRARGRAAAHAQPRVFKALLFLGAGAFERAVGCARARPPRRAPAADAVDRRRVPRRRAGDRRAAAAERVRLGVADAAGAARTCRRTAASGTGRSGRSRSAALAATAGARGALLREGGRPRAARPAAAAGVRGGGRARRSRCAAALVALAAACVVLGVVPGLLVPRARRPRAVADAGDVAGARRPRGARAPATLPDARHRLVARRGLTALLWLAARQPPRRAGPELGLRPAGRARARSGRAPASRSRSGSCSRRCCARSARSRRRCAAASCRRSRYAGHVPHLFDDAPLPPGHARRSARPPRGRGACRAASLGTYVAVPGRARRRPARSPSGSGRSDERRSPSRPARSRSSAGSRSRRSSPGSSSTGRRASRAAAAPSPLQPYRELRRLWGKSGVDVEGTTLVYRLAPPRRGRRAGRRDPARPGRRRRARPGRRPRRARARRPARARPLRGLRGRLGHGERLRAAWARAAT